MARHKKLEPIRLEDLENNPCASGLDSVLRFPVSPALGVFSTPPQTVPLVSTPAVPTPVESITPPTPHHISTPVESERIVSTPVESRQASWPPVAETTPVLTDLVVSTGVDTTLQLPAPRLFLARSKKRLFRPLRAADGHTDGEDRLYQFMWEKGTARSEGVRIYAGSMTSLARSLGRDDRNTRPLVESLIRKLSIQIAREQDFKTGQPRVYFVFDAGEIAARRRRAGLEWALKNKGIQLLTAAEAAELAAAETVSTPVDISGLFPPS